MRLIRQNQTAQNLTFLLVSATDHITPLTGAAPTVVLSKNGAAFAAPAGAVSEIGQGWYQVAGNAADSNTLGSLILHATATGGDPTDREHEIVSFDPQNGASLGLSLVPANLIQVAGQTANAAAAVTFPAAIGTSTFAGGAVASVTGAVGSVAGAVTLAAGQSTIASNFVAAPTPAQIAAAILAVPANLLSTDATGKVGANNLPAVPANFAVLGITAAGKITEVALVDTLTTYTGDTPQSGDAYAYLVANLGALGAKLTAAVGNVWAAATRTLTAGTNIVLAKGTGLTGLNDIAAGTQMDLINAPNAAAVTAIQAGLSRPGTAQTITPADTAAAGTAQGNVTTLLSRLTAVLAFDGNGNVKSAPQTAVTLAAGQSTIASNFVAAPTPAQVAAAILATPAHLLATDANGEVSTNNVAAAPTPAQIAAAVAAPTTAQIAAAVVAAVPAAPNSAQIQAAAAAAIGVTPVMLPEPPPSGYGGSSFPSGVIAALEAATQVILVQPYVPAAAPQLVIPAPSTDPTLCTVYAYLTTPAGAPAAGVVLKFDLLAPGPLAGNTLVAGRSVSAQSNAAGFVELTLERNDLLTPPGSTWQVTCAAAGWGRPAPFTLTAPTFNLAAITAP